MSDLSSAAKNAMNVFGDSLIVGNHDSITLFGIHPQNSMREYSRKVAEMLLKESADIDMAIGEVTAEIRHFEMRSQNPVTSLLRKLHYRKDIIKEYHKILAYIENMALYFKLQQAQLTKEVKLLEKMSAAIDTCSTELDQCIEIGTDTLRNRPTHDGNNPAMIKSDEDIWYDRLKRRIDDLKISHTVSLQSQTQINLLRNNYFVMLDKITNVISNTFPIWQNQMALMLGLELLETRIQHQDDINGTNGKHSRYSASRSLKNGQKTVDLQQILELNQSLGHALTEMVQLKQNDEILRKEFIHATHHIERG